MDKIATSSLQMSNSKYIYIHDITNIFTIYYSFLQIGPTKLFFLLN